VQEVQDQARWAEALATARQLEEVLAGRSHSDDLPQRLRERLADLKVVARLEEARILTAAATSPKACSGPDNEGAEAEYVNAFREYGLELEALDATEAAKGIQARPIALQLAAALDDWSRMRRLIRGEGDASWKHLLAVARAADPERWRNEVRDAWERKDRDALMKLAASAEVRDLPPKALDLLAWRLRDAGGIKEAVTLLREAQRRHPADFAINFDLGYCLNTEVKPPQSGEAMRFMTAAVALRPRSPGAYMILGNCFCAIGMIDDAIAAQRQAIQLKPDYGAAHGNLGIALMEKGLLDEAIAEFKWQIRHADHLEYAHGNLGNALRQKGKLDEAIAEYRKAIELKPDEAGYHSNLGNALADKSKLNEAIAEYRKAIELDPDFWQAHFNLGNALTDKSKLDEAIAEYRKAIELKHDCWKAHCNLGDALRRQGKLEEAITECQKAIELKPDCWQAHDNLGLALHQNGKLDEAITEHRKAIALKPDEALPHNNLGMALRDKGNLDEAIVEFKEALRLKASNVLAFTNLTYALGKKGWSDQAIGDFKEALRLMKPENADDHNNLAWLLATCPEAKVREPMRAVEFAKKAVELAPKEGNYWNTLGAAHYYSGDWKPAVLALEKSMDLRNGGDSFDWFFLAMAYWQLGNKDKARQWYEKAVEWMNKNQKQLQQNKQWDEELRRFRAEATQLLGLSEPPKKENVPKPEEKRPQPKK
jgi:tetratricopeptide (TPR) repeat protein